MRKEIEARYGALRAREAEPLADVASAATHGGVLLQVTGPSIVDADPALRAVLAASWQRALRATKRRAFVELAPSGALRAWLEGDDAAPLARTKEELRRPLAETEWKRALMDAGADARQQKLFLAQPLSAASQRTRQILAEAQRSIDRLRFEAEGGDAFLERLSSLTPAQLAELAEQL